MVGDIRIGSSHVLCAADYWRAPHDPAWPEAGVGLAGEFGCGDDGATCGAGWGAPGGQVPLGNGVLGYEEAGPGGVFLKLGVGALKKGSCAGCDPASADDLYRFNSPYAFAEVPRWHVNRTGAHSLELSHSAALPGGRWAYALRRSVELLDAPDAEASADDTAGRVRETWTLTNEGSETFASPYYSHNFFNLDHAPTGPGWRLQLQGVRAEKYTDGNISVCHILALPSPS